VRVARVFYGVSAAALSVPPHSFGCSLATRRSRRTFRTLQRAVLGVALAMLILFLTYPDALLNRLAVYSETLDPRSPASELMHRTRDYPLANFLAAFSSPNWAYGFGIGTVSLGGQYVARIFHVLPPTEGVESGYGILFSSLVLAACCCGSP